MIPHPCHRRGGHADTYGHPSATHAHRREHQSLCTRPLVAFLCTSRSSVNYAHLPPYAHPATVSTPCSRSTNGHAFKGRHRTSISVRRCSAVEWSPQLPRPNTPPSNSACSHAIQAPCVAPNGGTSLRSSSSARHTHRRLRIGGFKRASARREFTLNGERIWVGAAHCHGLLQAEPLHTLEVHRFTASHTLISISASTSIASALAWCTGYTSISTTMSTSRSISSSLSHASTSASLLSASASLHHLAVAGCVPTCA
ncbi:hypothetical protein K438DRAFT_362600 [Mycena galopus ATCC 62051]|nr:hypothetical protein K438DRAFT_362600 [Mycena galopus ATCC 62051]